MVLTAAERAKKYRDKKKSDPTSKQLFLSKDSERKRTSYISVEDRSSRDARLIRRRWRCTKKSSRARIKTIETLQRHLPTPPSTPRADEEVPNFVFPPVAASTSKSRGRKKVRKDRSKAYREIERLKKKMKVLQTKTEKYRKRLLRARTLESGKNDSPRTKTRKLLNRFPGKLKKTRAYTDVRKTLVFHNSLMQEIRERYSKTEEQREKSYLSCLLGGRIVKKYRGIRQGREAVKCFARKRVFNSGLVIKRQLRSDSIPPATVELVKAFYNRDDNSRILPGKKDTVTKAKVKEQKRLLLDTIQNIHGKFCYENPSKPISYASFCILRPFWVVIPSISDRDTCVCKKHSNCNLMADVLLKEGMISTSDLKELTKLLVCDIYQKSCMYKDCSLCEDKWFTPMEKHRRENMVEYYQWVNKKEQRTKTVGGHEQQFEVKITVKDKVTSTLWDLNEKFQVEMKTRFAAHLFNIQHQYKTLRELKANLPTDEAILHIDFSENYACKFAEEVQSVHFGASRNQVSLHTGICYIGTSQIIPFCSMSSSLRHDPVGIWAHLAPTLKMLTPSSSVSTLHFVSDGPTTQYRNKLNFHLASTYPFEQGYKHVTWNFLEAGHGKGAADGVGGTIKRAADRLVSNGSDIRDAEDLFKQLKPTTSIELFLVIQPDFDQFEFDGVNQLKTINGTMKLHQVLFHDGIIKHRHVSCFCKGTKEVSVAIPDPASSLPDPASILPNPLHPELLTGVSPDVSILDKWCVVVYEKHPYPGIITDFDDSSVEIKCMSRIGRNRFFWPTMEDQIWYDYDSVLGVIPEPTNVTSRHVQIDKVFWEAICLKLDMDE